MFDYAFAENGLTAYKLSKEFASQTFINWLGEERYKKLANFILHYIADMDIPIKRWVCSCWTPCACAVHRQCSCSASLLKQRHLHRIPQRHDQRQPHRPKRFVSSGIKH